MKDKYFKCERCHTIWRGDVATIFCECKWEYEKHGSFYYSYFPFGEEIVRALELREYQYELIRKLEKCLYT